MEIQNLTVQIKERELDAFVRSWPWERQGFSGIAVELSDEFVKLRGTYGGAYPFNSSWKIRCAGTRIHASLANVEVRGAAAISAQLALQELRNSMEKSLGDNPFLHFDSEGLYVDVKQLLAVRGIETDFSLTAVRGNKYQLSVEAGPSAARFPITPLVQLHDSPSGANFIWAIVPYCDSGTWVFDDATVGLEREPFVCGIPEMIDRMVAHIPDAKKGFRLLFSAGRFPGFQYEFEWKREEADGNWYAFSDGSAEGWLCPALFRYFETAPRRLFVKAEAIEK